MNKKIKLHDIKIEWLNKRALVLISIFSTAAHKQEKAVIDLRADNVLEQISSLVKTSGNKELASIYQRIKREIKVSLSEVSTDDKSAQELDEASVSTKDSIYLDRAYPL